MEDDKMGGQVPRAEKVDYLGKARGNPWIVSTVVLGIVLIVVLIYSWNGGLTGGVVSSERST